MNEIEKLNLESADLVAERIAQLKALFPEAFAEGGIDFAKLRLLLGDEVDKGTERYGFTWPGKTDAIRQSQTPSRATLRPAPEESVDWDSTQNLYIEGDNLEVLKLLQRSYHGRVKLIYIDPPYNTGNDFVYKDKFGDTIENYRKQAGLAGQSNADTSGRYHSDWCSMIYPRLKLARELLSDDGVIFISIDDSEVSNLKKICDEIFGEKCFVNMISVNMNSLSGVKMTHAIAGRRYPAQKEYLLLYKKGIEPTVFKIEKRSKAQWDKEYNLIIPQLMPGQFESFSTMDPEEVNKQLSNMTLESLSDYLQSEGVAPNDEWKWNNAYRIFGTKSNRPLAARLVDEQFSQQIVSYRNTEGSIRFFRSDYNKNTRDPRIELVQAEANSMVFLSDSWTDISNDGGVAQEGDVVFPNGKKPLQLVQRIIRSIPQNDCMVLDFFAGSSTTAHAVMRQNIEDRGLRKFIMVQLPEMPQKGSEAEKSGFRTICDLGKKRLKNAGKDIESAAKGVNKQLRLGEEPKPVPDIGFRVFKLDESGISRPQEGDLIADVRKPGRSDEDIIFEMMLKWGLELTLPVKKVEAAGYPCWSVAEGELVCCLASGLTMQAIDAIADMAPRRVLLLDGILNDTLKLNAVQAFKRVEEKTGREVELRTV